MASWKILPSISKEAEYTSFLECHKYFAVDDSGSTAGAVLRQERAFVEAVRKNNARPDEKISLWGWHCDDPTTNFESVQWRSQHGGTYPSNILKNSAALSAIRNSDAWFLLTDGEVPDSEVHHLSSMAYETEVLDVPLVFVITGFRGSAPGTANISVGIAFFASAHDTLILFKDVSTGKMYVIAGKGCFAELALSAEAQDLDSWDNLPTFTCEANFFQHCQKNNIMVAKSTSRARSTGALGLGTVWEEQHGAPIRVDLDLLLRSGVLADTDATHLLASEAFDALAVACKTRRRIPELRAFVQAQKIEQFAPKLEDLNGAATIIASIADETTSDGDRKILQQQLREAHAKNRRDFLQLLADFEGSEAAQTIKKRNQLVDAALRSLASVEGATYSADILSRKSNRARRAEGIDSIASVSVAELDLEAPSCKGFCLVCCGEEEIMAICFKETDPEHREDNTSDFALNFPLAAGASQKNVDLISSQNVCFQCALHGQDGVSIYKERLTAIIPAVQYDGNNKAYINNQLYAALTARLVTGAAGVAQLFMSILHNVIRTKAWAGAGTDSSRVSEDERFEATQRQKTFNWMLDQFVQNTYTRENFKETGQWVKFPKALESAATDFECNKLASFAITYPLAGFNTLIALGQRADVFSDDLVNQLQSAKSLYSITAKYLAELQVVLQSGAGAHGKWKQKYLELMYRDFNGPLIPSDHGAASILSDFEIFKQRLSSALSETSGITESTMLKLQILLFWLVFTQNVHVTAQTFFTRITHSENLATAVLSPDLPLPSSSHQNILLSIFASHNASLINPSLAASHSTTLIPFANPFGASVLRCGALTCNHSFYDPAALRAQPLSRTAVESIRRARAAHLIDVFGVRGRFESSSTGLPDRGAAGQPPSSIHCTLHIGVVREWAARCQDERREIVRGGAAQARFIVDVRMRLAEEGRGDVFTDRMDKNVKDVLPSFFEVLALALRAEGKSGDDVALYEHDFKKNALQDKVAWELMQESDPWVLL